jgi:hypothetical protein
MNLLKFFRPHPEGGRYCSTKVNEIEKLLTANGGVRTHVAGDGEYVYEWKCKGHVVIVNYRGSDWQGKAFAYIDVGLV